MGSYSWRFDQGRLDYLQFDEVKNIARALCSVDGIEKPTFENDLLRSALNQYSDLPFAPLNYTVWRNYKRVFGCLMLATEIDGRIVCTDLCHALAKNDSQLEADDYFFHISRNFSYPSPVFEGYGVVTAPVFPIISVIKLLIAQLWLKKKSYVTLQEIYVKIISRHLTGCESFDFYMDLPDDQMLSPIDFDLRQVRELVRFISQFSFLKWENPKLHLDTADQNSWMRILQLLQPNLGEMRVKAEAELMRVGALIGKDPSFNMVDNIPQDQDGIWQDAGFTEGGRVQVTHLRLERSSKLRDFYFAQKKFPHICHMCQLDTLQKYPWLNRLIEVHHLLLLSSSVRVASKITSLADVVGLCPNCHRATHKYYSYWFKLNSVKDFSCRQQAVEVYEDAKQEVRNV